MSALRAQLVHILAQRLGETEPAPIAQIARICECMPPERILELVQRTERIEQAGGMHVYGTERRKTKAGVFFWLARTRKYGQLTKAQRRYCYPPREHGTSEVRHAA